ncbi:helix-turn-helix domain-containing protein [Microbacterium sp. NPDC079995]|uniref:winged helix-turn-helix transcriptional regulator n=1 Tax=unclassified Microbacterium TaxID=2609290 RepID=UPI00344D24E8
MSAAQDVNARCSIARSLEILGEKWALLIVREAHFGATRFAEFRTRLGIAPDVLTARLETLVAGGVLDRRPYRAEGQRQRYEYVLTEAGAELKLLLAAFVTWGDVHRPTGSGASVVYVKEDDETPVRVAFLDVEGHEVCAERIALIPGPGGR